MEGARPLPEFERRPDAPELEAVDELHDDDRWIGLRSELEDLHDTTILEERHGAGFAQKIGKRCRGPAIGSDHLGRDDAIELEVLQFEHLAHTAGAHPFNRPKAFEDGQRLDRRRRVSAGEAGPECAAQAEVAIDQRPKRPSQIRTALDERLEGKLSAVKDVVLDKRANRCSRSGSTVTGAPRASA